VSRERSNVLRMRTPEGVEFSLCIASPVLRLVAMTVDWAAVSAAWSVVAGLLMILATLSVDVARMLEIAAFFVLSQGYRIAAEWKWNGQTLGKRLLGLRVVDSEGRRLTFEQVVIRNLLRFADVLPGAYLLGGASALLSPKGQRLGDIAAGTLVVRVQSFAAPDLGRALSSGKYNSLRGQVPVVARLRQAVPREAALVAVQALSRRGELEAGARLELFGELAAYFRGVTRVPAELTDGLSDEQFVRNVVDVIYVSR
jgi:uncharacterized RDD family membrane protein YckC